MKNPRPPERNKDGGSSVDTTEAAAKIAKKKSFSNALLGNSIVSQKQFNFNKNNLTGLIAHAQRMNALAAPDDARHGLILFELLRLAIERSGNYRPGPRFGDNHKSQEAAGL